MLTVSVDDELDGASRFNIFGELLFLHCFNSFNACSSRVSSGIGPGGLNNSFLSASYNPSTQFPHCAAVAPPPERTFAAFEQSRSVNVTLVPVEPLRQVLVAAGSGSGICGAGVAGTGTGAEVAGMGAGAGWVLLALFAGRAGAFVDC